MRIYTKTGDKGQTSLFDGTRLAKSNAYFDLLGEMDHLSANLGLCIAIDSTKIIPENEFTTIQKKLMGISALLAKAVSTRDPVTPEDTQFLEARIDYYWQNTAPLKQLILPGGSPLGAQVHCARTVARKVERQFHSVDLASLTEENTAEIATYLNRLSDYLFALARYINEQAGKPEQEWQD